MGSTEAHSLNRSTLYKNTLNMAWPAVLESFLISLTGFLDTIMVSALGITTVAAVGLTSQPKFLGLCVFFAMGIAISSITARRRGENDRKSANKVLRTSLIIGLIFTAIITFTFVFFADYIMIFSGSNQDTHQISVEYLQIIMAGTGFSAVSIIINASQRGAGRTRVSMVTNITSNVVNVLCNYLLIEGNFGFPALGANGAAYATVIGGAVACIMSIISITKKDGFIYLKAVKGLLANSKDVKSLINVGTSSFVEQIFMRIGFILFVRAVAGLGTLELAAHQIGMNFIGISFSFADGLAVASVALVGRSLGQQQSVLAKRYATACQIIGVFCSLFLSSIFIFFGRSLFSLFSDVTAVLDYGNMIMLVLSVIIILQIQQVCIMGCLRGSGDTKYTAFISLISVTIIRPLASYILAYPLGLGLFGIWLGLGCDQLARFILSFLRFKKGNWLNLKI